MLAQHKAEELLLRAVACPVADTLLSFSGLREPGCVTIDAGGKLIMRNASDCTVVVAAAVATHWAQTKLWGAFRDACGGECAAAAPAIAAAAGYKQGGLARLQVLSPLASAARLVCYCPAGYLLFVRWPCRAQPIPASARAP